MKKLILIFPVFLFTLIATGQVINIQAGVSSTSLNWRLLPSDNKIFKNTINGQSIFLGLDYFEHKYFNLSSNIGFLRKGGRSEVFYFDSTGIPGHSGKAKVTFDYLSFNTVIDLKYPINDHLVPYISIGPRIDYMLSKNSTFSSYAGDGNPDKFSYGAILGAGIKYTFSKLHVGLRGDYLLNFNNIAAYNNPHGTPSAKISDRTFLISATLGLKIK